MECCNTQNVIYLICIPTLAVSGAKLFYFLGFGFLSPCVVAFVMHLISCHHVHCICIHVRLMHPIFFPVVRFAFRCSYLLRCPFSTSFHVWGLNISGLDRDLPRGLGLLSVDRLSSFVLFGLHLILQRLTEGPKRPRVCCSPTPLQFGPKTHQTLLHRLGRSITIAWAKTAPHLDSPSSLYLYICVPPRNSRFFSPLNPRSIVPVAAG